MKLVSVKKMLPLLVMAFIIAGPAQLSWAGDMSDERVTEWEKNRQALQRDYQVCNEHCAGDRACLDRCEQAYKAKLDRAYQEFLSQAPGADIQKHAACPFCGMDRTKWAHSRVFVEYSDGSTLGTCSIHCAAVDMAVNIDKTPLKIWVGDFNSKKLIDAETAVWTLVSDKPGVMTRRAKWAFSDKDAAEAYMKANGGTTAGFEEIMEATYEDMYKDTRMIREKRKMKRMSMKNKKH